MAIRNAKAMFEYSESVRMEEYHKERHKQKQEINELRKSCPDLRQPLIEEIERQAGNGETCVTLNRGFGKQYNYSVIEKAVYKATVRPIKKHLEPLGYKVSFGIYKYNDSFWVRVSWDQLPE